ncbi:hypothetical protein L195_g039138, partial [Trifolium pratense]
RDVMVNVGIHCHAIAVKVLGDGVVGLGAVLDVCDSKRKLE